MEEKYILARFMYSIGEDYITDTEYDRLHEHIVNNNLLPEYTSRGWNEDPIPYSILKLHGLESVCNDMVFTYATESIPSVNTEEEVHKLLGNLNKESRLSYKLDGFSIRLNYYDGRLVYVSSRNRRDGNPVIMESIRKLFKETIPLKCKVILTGELFLVSNKFEQYKTLRCISSQRNGVSTAIANGDWEYLGYRCYNIYYENLEDGVDKYELIKSLGVPTPKFITVSNYAGLMKAVQILGKGKASYPIPTDGLVFENSENQLAIRIGAWESELNQSYVIGYTIKPGMYNYSVICQIAPITMRGKVVKNIPIYNLQHIIDNDLQVGSPIGISERSGVISGIDTELTKELHIQYAGRYKEYREGIYGQ